MYDPSSPLLRSGSEDGAPPAPEAKARFAEDRLLDAVIWCEIRPGEILTEADAMERFGLTRAAARAGLTRLGYDNWALPQPRTGWLILPVTGALIGQVLEARRIAEPMLSTARLDVQARAELKNIADVIEALHPRDEAAAIASFRHYVDRIDGLLLGAINPFTARHLRKLWHHTARITRFLEDESDSTIFRRDDINALVKAVLSEDADAVAAARLSLIDAQEAFFLRQLLKSEAPLTPGSGVIARSKQTAAPNRRPS
ncbi:MULTISPECIES: GntR family transcriptional regulator [unclassified Ruegeria]|uniref:GntR family transcriptional regulator n=1 Tax=unclassified Ruegeria TaxID=2625375 RepID=UPI00148833E4|nr:MULTISPECIES: GntR family transcriptional regulator [unclassified Ruegeria]